MNNNDLETIQKRIDYTFENLDLLQQAFVRRSYSRENGGEDNEVLEFIGDKVLDFIIVKRLAETYGFMISDCDDFNRYEDFDEFACEKNESQLSEIKKELIQKKSLAEQIDRLKLADYLIVGKGDRRQNTTHEPSVKEDLFEAILGAVAIDCNWNIAILTEVVNAMLMPERILDRDEEEINYMAYIDEWHVKNYYSLPTFHYGETSGWYAPVRYEVRTQAQRLNLKKCWINVFGENFIGSAPTQTEARLNACISLYNYLKQNNLLLTIRDEIANPNPEDAISQLEILARRGYFSIPVYKFKELHDENGNPIWHCKCRISEEKKTYSAKSSSKKEAKKAAAYKMLRFVLKK